MNGFAAAVSAAVLIVVIAAWPTALLVVLVAMAIDRRPPRSTTARHRCAGENSAVGCSHIRATSLRPSPSPVVTAREEQP